MKYHKIPNRGNFGSMYYYNDTLNILTTIQSYSKPKESFAVYRNLVLARAYKGKFVSINWITEQSAKKEIIDENGGLYCRGSLVYFRTLTAKFNRATTIFKIYRKQNGKLEYYKKVDFNVPEDLIKNYNEDLLVNKSTSNNGLFYFYSSNTVFDVRSQTTLKLPFYFLIIDFDEVRREGAFRQTQLSCITNYDYIWSALFENDSLKMVVLNRNTDIEQIDVMPITHSRNSLYSLSSNGLYIYDKREKMITHYPIIPLNQ
jgi:hypothetical protein